MKCYIRKYRGTKRKEYENAGYENTLLPVEFTGRWYVDSVEHSLFLEVVYTDRSKYHRGPPVEKIKSKRFLFWKWEKIIREPGDIVFDSVTECVHEDEIIQMEVCAGGCNVQ